MKIKLKLLALVLALGLLDLGLGATPQAPRMPEVERIRLAEAFRLGSELRDQIWEGWSNAPFAVLFVMGEHEFLMRHPKSPEDFRSLGRDPLLGTEVYYRKRTQNENLLAAFPFHGIPTIVVGTVAATGQRGSTQWVLTLLHEHFHQWQDSQPGAFDEYLSLGLARGDQTGMWMLNYAFPYDDATTQKNFVALCSALVSALRARGTPQFQKALAAYLSGRKRFQVGLALDDYKYFSFQLWKEGVARYTEMRIARLAAEKYRPSPGFEALADFESFAGVARAIEERIFAQLEQSNLSERRRTAFYAVGAAEALLLDAARPGWQRHYLTEKFYLEKYYPASAAAASGFSRTTFAVAEE